MPVSISKEDVVCGSRYFCESLFEGVFARTSSKNYAITNAGGCPDSSVSLACDPTRGRSFVYRFALLCFQDFQRRNIKKILLR